MINTVEELDLKLISRRNYYRKRRNLFRRIFLVLFIFLFILFLNFIYHFSVENEVKLNFLNSKYINVPILLNEVNSEIVNKNFFLIFPGQIKEKIIKNCPLIKSAVVRKYLFPTPSIYIFILEKEIWGFLKVKDKFDNSSIKYLLDDGIVLPDKYINKSVFVKSLWEIKLNQSFLENNQINFLYLKDALNTVVEVYRLKLSNIEILDNGDLQFICNGVVLVKAGKINEDLDNKILKLEDALSVINDRKYNVNYLDLTLEESVVFKTKI